MLASGRFLHQQCRTAIRPVLSPVLLRGPRWRGGGGSGSGRAEPSSGTSVPPPQCQHWLGAGDRVSARAGGGAGLVTIAVEWRGHVQALGEMNREQWPTYQRGLGDPPMGADQDGALVGDHQRDLPAHLAVTGDARPAGAGVRGCVGASRVQRGRLGPQEVGPCRPFRGRSRSVSCPFRAGRRRRHPGSGRSGTGWPGR